MKVEKILYKGKATATGGRDGKIEGENGSFNLKLTTPKELGGGGGEGTNPEQIFAAGYSACFIGALKFCAMQEKIKLSPETKINGIVGIGQITGGFGIEVELQISLPGLDPAVAKSLVDKAHIVCPYSNATRGNINVTLTLL
jgi:osmotically inducible protein OsmC